MQTEDHSHNKSGHVPHAVGKRRVEALCTAVGNDGVVARIHGSCHARGPGIMNCHSLIHHT